MRLVTFKTKTGGGGIGVLEDNEIIVVSRLSPDLPGSMVDLIEGGSETLRKLQNAVDSAPESAKISADNVEFLPPVPRPPKIICMGLNFTDHAAEGGNPIPDYPAVFMRTASSLIGHKQALIRPLCSDLFDYEAELLVVVGKRGRHIKAENALDYVFGYSVFNDASVRDYQRKSAQWTAGKNFDGTGPVGPAIVTADEVPAGAEGLKIQSRLNGQLLQDGNTSNMIFSVPRTLEILSEFMTLEPGDYIAMGTPAGVGYPRNPPVFMKSGDIMEIEIEGLGVLQNPVKDETTEHHSSAA